MESKSSQKTMTCRKDMQCTCSMCLASFQATWDLRRPLPSCNAFQTITNVDDSFSDFYRTPTPPRFRRGKENDTPRSIGNDEKICRPVTPFPLGSPSHPSLLEPTRNGFSSLGRVGNGRSWSERRMRLKSLALLVCLVSVTFMLPRLVLKTYPPILSGEEVVEIVEDSRVRMRLEDRFDLIQRRLSQSLPGQAVGNCSGSIAWTLKDADSLLRSECTFFSSPGESVTVWGYPVKTAGILSRAARDRNLTVVSGRVLEWREGGLEYVIHNEGGSWVHPQWAASTVQLEGQTWIVEYKAGLFSGLGSFSGMTHFLRHQARKLISKWNAAFKAATMAYSMVTYKTETEILPT